MIWHWVVQCDVLRGAHRAGEREDERGNAVHCTALHCTAAGGEGSACCRSVAAGRLADAPSWHVHAGMFFCQLRLQVLPLRL
jgi:hypothetical protein